MGCSMIFAEKSVTGRKREGKEREREGERGREEKIGRNRELGSWQEQ